MKSESTLRLTADFKNILDGTMQVEIEFRTVEGNRERMRLPREQLSKVHEIRQELTKRGAGPLEDLAKQCHELLSMKAPETHYITR